MTDTANDQGTEPQALPGDGLREGIVDELRRRLGDAVVDVELRPQDDLWVRVTNEAWPATGEALRSMGFTYFCFLSGLDWLPSPYGRGEDNPDEPTPERSTEIVQGVAGGDTRFQVFARVVDPIRHVGVTVKADVDDAAPAIGSWHTIWAGANWHERETHEMFGIAFTGHPDLRNMYLPGDFEGHPLRKDFPLLSRMIKPWPGIVDVEPMPAEEEDADGASAGATDAPAPADPTAITEDATPAAADEAAAVADGTAAPAAEAAPADDAAPVDQATSIDGAAAPEAAASDETTSVDAGSADGADDGPDATADEQLAADAAAAEAATEDAAAAESATDESAADGPAATEAAVADEPAADDAADVQPLAATGDGWSPDIPVADVDGPYGPGSKGPRPDGDEPPDHPIKATSATMRFYVPGSEGYDELTPDVWFDSDTTAREAGFLSPYDEVAVIEASPEPFGPGSRPAQPGDAQPDGFPIKGNANSMLFHVPGSRYYDATKAEVWFDTEERARAAGFRAPGDPKDGSS